jgi:hypothetical protein
MLWGIFLKHHGKIRVMARSASWQDPRHGKIRVMARSASWQDPRHGKIRVATCTGMTVEVHVHSYFTKILAYLHTLQFNGVLRILFAPSSECFKPMMAR